MRITVVLIALLCAIQAESQFWNYPQKFFSTLFRQGKTESDNKVKIASSADITTAGFLRTTTRHPTEDTVSENIAEEARTVEMIKIDTETALPTLAVSQENANVGPDGNKTTSESTEYSTLTETTTDVANTTEEWRNNHQKHEMFLSKREKPQVKVAYNISQNLLPLPAGASAALVKPTKYHYYPHNQHIYLLPECAIQQVCNAVYIRLNWTQPLCACPSRYRDPCSASLNTDDNHTTELTTDKKSRKVLTLVKTCEPISEMRVCHSPRDWSLLALQNIRTGKSHYLVICRCPESSILEGPMSHDQPTYASVPGIRVYGMMCVDAKRKRSSRAGFLNATSLWQKAIEFSKTVSWL